MMSFRINWDKLIANKTEMQICGTRFSIVISPSLQSVTIVNNINSVFRSSLQELCKDLGEKELKLELIFILIFLSEDVLLKYNSSTEILRFSLLHYENYLKVMLEMMKVNSSSINSHPNNP